MSPKSVQSEPRCFMQTDGRTDRRTDMTKLIVVSRNFANASKNQYFSSGVLHKVCHTAGCYCMSYFEYKYYTNTCQIINHYTATSFRLWQTLLSRTHYSPQAWPARSPDLTPVSSLRGHKKDIIYR
jgi:hypothetical protein